MHYSVSVAVILSLVALTDGHIVGSQKTNVKRNSRTNTRKLSSKGVAVADLSVTISEKSGAIEVGRAKMGKKKDKETKVKISIEALREVDIDGVIVGEKESEKHSIESFTEKDFTFGIEDTIIALTPSADDATNGTSSDFIATADGKKISFSTTLDTGSALDIHTYFFSGEGEVGTMTEKWAVQPGDMKFNIGLKDWVWCDPCEEGTGAFVEVDVEIKGSAPPVGKGKKGMGPKGEKGKGVEKEWDLGQGATLDLSELVMVDGNLTSMPVGYPKLEVKGSKQLYTFRFPRFKESVLYDPVVSFNPDAFDDSSARSYGLVGGAAYVTGMIIWLLF